jgi:two-component system, NtrC family, sensor histidine kinase KinB
MTNVATDEPDASRLLSAGEQPLMTARMDPLIRITQAIETAATLDELLLLSLHELTRLLSVERGGVALLYDGAARLASEYPPQLAPSDLRLADLPSVQQAFRERRPVQVYCGDWDSYPRVLAEILRTRETRAALIVPLVAQDDDIGVLVLGTADGARLFSPDEAALARVLAGQIAAAITAFRINEAAQRRNQELSTLNEIAATITSTLDTREVYRLVVQKLNQYFRVEAGSLLLRDDVSGDLEFVMTIEGGEEKLAGVRVPAGQGVVGHVVATGEWEIVADVERDPRFYRKVSEDAGFVTRSILCVPMVAKGRVMGAVELLNKLDGPFGEEDAERLLRMAAFIAVAIENAHLFQQVTDGRDRLEAILNSTADGILMADPHGVVLSANPMAERICERDEAELVGSQLERLLEALYGRAHEVVTRSWGGAGGEDGEADGPLQVTEIALGGTRRRFVRLLRLPVRDALGVAYGELVVLRDITQEKELEQLREDYTSMLVHDLRAPLTSIMNGVMMVQRGLSGPVTDQQRELLKIAYQGSETMLELINNLLDISKMEQGQMTLDLRPLSPYIVIDKAVERLKASAASAKVDLAQSLEVNLPLVEADEDKIVRVLQNLLDNAIKFSRPGSSITVGAHYAGGEREPSRGMPLANAPRAGDWLVMWVQDQGIGIPPAYFERIFEKFGQVRGRKVRGTGLGLTFCKLSVEAHCGRIWVESEEGRGSVFAFCLPLNRESD